VTDHDLRTRVIAERTSLDAPVIDVATRPVREVGADTQAGEALLEMLTHAIHHLPVLDGARLIGVVTNIDLMGVAATSPFEVRSAIERARTEEEVIEAAGSFRTVAADMVDAGVDATDVSRVVSVIADAATQRFLQLAIDVLGAPPCRYSWMALGSAARHELALDAEQAHALAFGPGFDAAAHDGSFAALADRVTAGLGSVGFPRSRGGAIAVHPEMRATLPHWSDRFRTWIDQPGADAITVSSIAFDFREVGGSLEAGTTLDATVADARTDPAFLHLLARIALREEPPTGFVRGLVVASTGEHAGRLDLTHAGIDIVTAIARARAIAAGASAKGTLSRLEAAVQGGTLSLDSGTELAEAFRFMLDLRLRHQTAQVREGVVPDALIDPAELGTIERSGLREAFRTIRGEQQLLARELDVV
jgi:CBS domain-containing protein